MALWVVDSSTDSDIIYHELVAELGNSHSATKPDSADSDGDDSDGE